MLSALTSHECIYGRDCIVDSKLASSPSLAKRISELVSYVHFYSATRCLKKIPSTLSRAVFLPSGSALSIGGCGITNDN